MNKNRDCVLYRSLSSHMVEFPCLTVRVCFRLSGLSLEQVDILWHCLVEDAECYDDALHWFLNQVRSKDQHAMGMETYKHLFLEKVGAKNECTKNMSDIRNDP